LALRTRFRFVLITRITIRLSLFLCLWGVAVSALGTPYLPNEVLVTLSAKISKPSEWGRGKGLEVESFKPPFRGPQANRSGRLRLKITDGRPVQQHVAELQKHADVIQAQPNYIYQLFDITPNDPFFSQQWALRNTSQNGGVLGADIKAPQAWDFTTGSEDLVVAVIDTGIDYNHPDLVANLWTNPGEIAYPNDGVDNDGNGYVDDWRGWDFHDRDNNPWDDHSHGTHVSGILGAVGNNSTGVCGVAWRLKIIPLDAFSTDGTSYSSDLIEAIEYADRMGARIINASWGDQYDDPAMLIAIREFTAGGGLFVCAAGNEDGENNDWFTSYPANFDVDALISVGAGNKYESVSSFSSIGKNRVHLFAPGESIYSTLPGGFGNYGNKSGTSMASPLVVGTAALLWAYDPSLSNLEVKYRILGGTDFRLVYSGKCLSGGRLNASRVFGGDRTPPAAITDLTASGFQYDRLKLEFTATGDDGYTGNAMFYEIRYSYSPIHESNWESTFRAYDVPAPSAAGTRQSYTLLRLEDSKPHYIRMKVIDESGNISPLSNEVVRWTASVPVLFSDDMESGVGGWTTSLVSPATQTWTLTSEKARSGTYSWTDSPLGVYGKGDVYLVSPPIDLSSAQAPVLRFWHRYDFEPLYFGQVQDYGAVQVSTDGQNWSEPVVKYWDGADWWMLETLDLSQWKGESSVHLRFQVHADAPVDEDDLYEGWYIDDVRVVDIQYQAGVQYWQAY